MKPIFLLLFLTLCACNHHTTIYLVRHAEKVDDSRDPELSEAGKQRAAMLADKLKDENIKVIYSTDFKRTMHTATPLANMKDLKIEIYRADSLKAFATQLLNSKKNSLVVGHSNTTISLLDAFAVERKIKKLEDNDYGNLFKLILTGKKKWLEELKY